MDNEEFSDFVLTNLSGWIPTYANKETDMPGRVKFEPYTVQIPRVSGFLFALVSSYIAIHAGVRC